MKIIFILSLLFALSAILIVSIGMTPVFGQLTNESIVVTTDKASYSPGETIVITGKVRDIYSGTPVSVIVKAPNGNLVSITQVEVGADKKFSLEHTTESALMKTKGVYIVTAQYGTVNRSDETTFEFSGSTSVTVPHTITDTTISVQGFNGVVEYEIIGGQLQSFTPDEDANSLIIGIDARSNGSLTLTIPRYVLDAIMINGYDDDFFIMIDGDEANYDETTTSTDRTLTIPFPSGAEEIEIIGTFVIDGTTNPPNNSVNNKITVIMHKSTFESGDRLYINGKVPQFLQGEKLTWSIFSPSENKVATGKASVGIDKKFVIFEVTGGKKWKQSGQYIIEFSYGSVVSKKIINYIGATPHIPTPHIPTSSNKISIPVGTSVPGCEDTNRCYSPFKVIVSTGATVMWSNDDSAVHTVTSGNPVTGPSSVFDSSLIMSEGYFDFTFNKAGTYDYFCMVHPWMTGSVVVTGESISIPDNNKILNKIHKLESESSMLQLKMDKINLEIKNLYELLDRK